MGMVPHCRIPGVSLMDLKQKTRKTKRRRRGEEGEKRGGTHNQMTGSGSLDQVQREPVIRALEHVESLAEAQITKDINSQVGAPVAHILGYRPALAVASEPLANNIAEGADVAEDEPLGLADGVVGEGGGEDAALAGVDLTVAGVVGVGHGVGEGVVELGLDHVGLEAVDVAQGRRRVEGDAVGTEAHDRAVALVQPPELEVPVAAVGVDELVGVGELGQHWARVLGQRVEEDSVDGEASSLFVFVRLAL